MSILRALAVQIRIVSLDQVARGWFPAATNAKAEAMAALCRLEHCDLICRRLVEAHPVIPLPRPMFIWKPTESDPSDDVLEEIAAKSSDRWSDDDAPVEVYYASCKATRLFGAFSDVRRAKHCEATHDLHLSEVFLRYREKTPRLAESWRGESAFPKFGFEFKGMKDPDAFLLDARFAACRVIEFSGKYSVDHLRQFHQHCSGLAAKRLAAKRGSVHSRSLPAASLLNLYSPEGTRYEIW